MILVIFGSLLFGILSVKAQSDTICLTDREYNDLLVKSNCAKVIHDDSVLISDRNDKIADLYEKNKLEHEHAVDVFTQLGTSKTQLKSEVKKVIRWKFITFGTLAVWVASLTYIVIHK